MEKALPMFVLGIGCIIATAVVFGILCGHMIRARRLILFFIVKYFHVKRFLLGKIERIQRENEQKQDQYPVYILTSQSQNSLKLPTSTMNK